jgi:hypothetical protein
MSFWEELSPSVKRYIVFAAVLLVALLAFKKCVPSTARGGHAPPRGLSGPAQ